MTIYTPGGMPISFPMRYAFTLLARLYPKYRPHKVLKIAEGMDAAPEAVAFLLAFVLFSLHLSPLIIFIIVVIVPAMGRYMQINSKYINILVSLGVLFSTIAKFGLASIGLAVFGWYSVSWQGLVAFLSARFLGGIINTLLEAQARNQRRLVSGVNYNEFDRCFIDAYRFCADKIGVTQDISASEEELESDRWYLIYIDYSQQNPTLFKVREFI